MLERKITVVFIVIFSFICVGYSIGFCHASEIPERRLVIKKAMDGISINKWNNEISYYPGKDRKLPPGGVIHLPAGESISVDLGDSRLNPDRYRFDPEDVKALCQQSPYLVQELEIHFASSEKRIRQALQAIRNQKALTQVTLYQSAFSADTLSPLAGVKSLSYIDFTLCEPRPGGSLGDVFKDSNLKTVVIYRGHLKNTFVELTKIKSLKEIMISRAAGIGPLDFAGMQRHEGITTLTLSRIFLDDSKTSGSEFGNLKTLVNLNELTIDLDGGRPIGDYSFLDGLKNLKKLSLTRTGMKAGDLVHLASLTQLEELDLSRQDLSKSDLSELKHLHQLRKFTCHYTSLSDSAKKTLAELKNFEVNH